MIRLIFLILYPDLTQYAVRGLAILDVILLVALGVFLVDYHRHEVPRTILRVLWVYIAAITGSGIGIMLNVIYNPPPTPGVYVSTIFATVCVGVLGAVAVESVKHR